MESSEKKWLTSKEAIKIAGIKDCELMHYRLQGKLDFEKKGNAYFYLKKDVEKISKKKP